MRKQLIPVQHDFYTRKVLDKLVSVVHCSPCTVGKNRGFVKRKILSFHCGHQEALCAQMCGEQLGGVMSGHSGGKLYCCLSFKRSGNPDFS